MTSLMRRHGGTGAPARGIDRMVGNVQTGHFERSLSALTAAGALVTAAEIFFEHDSASFGNKMMWIPVALGPDRSRSREAPGGHRMSNRPGRGASRERVTAASTPTPANSTCSGWPASWACPAGPA